MLFTDTLEGLNSIGDDADAARSVAGSGAG